MDPEAPSNPSAMLTSLLSKRKKLHEELRSIEKQVIHPRFPPFNHQSSAPFVDLFR
ncbi:hypothetical protein ACLOJK_009612 [Asimina triloba]